jgi:hypothetical protein
MLPGLGAWPFELPFNEEQMFTLSSAVEKKGARTALGGCGNNSQFFNREKKKMRMKEESRRCCLTRIYIHHRIRKPLDGNCIKIYYFANVTAGRFRREKTWLFA